MATEQAAGEWANEVRLVGRVSADPDEREMPSGDTVVLFRLVVPRDAPTTAGSRGASLDTIDVACWAGRAKTVVAGCGPATTPRSPVPCAGGSSVPAGLRQAAIRWTPGRCAAPTAAIDGVRHARSTLGPTAAKEQLPARRRWLGGAGSAAPSCQLAICWPPSSARRSSVFSPPQTPWDSRTARAWLRHSCTTGQRSQ